jgi:hypothetical protein
MSKIKIKHIFIVIFIQIIKIIFQNYQKDENSINIIFDIKKIR